MTAFSSSMGVVSFVQYVLSLLDQPCKKDNSTGRLEKDTIFNSEFYPKMPECPKLKRLVLLRGWPTVEDVML